MLLALAILGNTSSTASTTGTTRTTRTTITTRSITVVLLVLVALLALLIVPVLLVLLVLPVLLALEALVLVLLVLRALLALLVLLEAPRDPCTHELWSDNLPRQLVENRPRGPSLSISIWYLCGSKRPVGLFVERLLETSPGSRIFQDFLQTSRPRLSKGLFRPSTHY